MTLYNRTFRQPNKVGKALNEFKEPKSKFGDWLPRADETVWVRDKRIWANEMKRVRRQYREEHLEKFRQRLAEYTRLADEHHYRLNLRKAQERERTRLRNIRVGALEAANKASLARKRLDLKRVRQLVEFDNKEQRRDVIRQMLWEKPSENWIVKENFNQLNMDHMRFLDFDDVPEGMPEQGDYDTFEGLMRYSDQHFKEELSEREKDEPLRLSSPVTGFPLPVHVRKDDSRAEYIKEDWPWKQPGYESYSPDTLEFETKEGNLMPNYWFNINWNKQFDQRQNREIRIDSSPAFVSAEICADKLDIWEDYRLLKQPAFWNLIKECQDLTPKEVNDRLVALFVDLIPQPLIDERKSNDNSDSDNNNQKQIRREIAQDMVCESIKNDEVWRMKQEMHHKKWHLYQEMYDRNNHRRRLKKYDGKMNFDSGLRKWQKDVIKLKGLIFDSQNDYNTWKSEIRCTELSYEMTEKCKLAVIRIQQLEHLMQARRYGPKTMDHLIQSIDRDSLKIWYIWMEELCEKGHRVAIGEEGWSFNRYDQTPHLFVDDQGFKSVPVHYFKLPMAHSVQNAQALQDIQFAHKSH